MPSDSVQVLIVGGGAAGIGAAQRLAEAHVDYLLVEARPRLGGRAWTVESEFPLDLGCGWLHSADINPWTAIAQHQGRAIDKTPPPWTRPSTQIDFPLSEQGEFGRAMGEFFDKLHSAEDAPDRPASHLLEPGGRWNALINAVSTYINGAELDLVSTRDFALYLDTEVNWRAAEGYGAVITAAAAGMTTMLDCPVTEIDHTGAKVRVRTPRGDIAADAVITTVSSALLAEERICFTPALPEKIQAASSLPLGLADKLFLSLSHADEFEKDSRLFGRTNDVGTAAYHLRPFGRPMIEVYFGGRLADDLEGEGGRAFVDFASHELAGLLGSSFISRINPIQLSQWRSDPFARGSYSYAVPGHHGDRVKLAAPVDNRLFFAGEACSSNSFSTAHGAYLSGRDAAASAIAALGVQA